MTSTPTIRGDNVLATVSVLRTLIVELDRSGAMGVGTFLAAVDDDSVAAHWERADSNQLANANQAIASHFRESLSALPRSDH
jgi:hypothetical protein